MLKKKKSSSDSDDPLQADIRAGVANTHTSPNMFVFLHFLSQLLCTSSLLPKLGLCFVFRARNILECCWCSVHTNQCTALRAHTMSQVMSPSTLTSMAPSNSVMRNGQAATIPLVPSTHKKYDVYTLLSHAHFLCVTYRHRAHAWLKCLYKSFDACACRISSSRLHHSFFIRRPCCSRTVTSTPPSRPHRLRRAVLHIKRTSARAPRSLATWPIPRILQVVSQNHTRKYWTVECSHSV